MNKEERVNDIISRHIDTKVSKMEKFDILPISQLIIKDLKKIGLLEYAFTGLMNELVHKVALNQIAVKNSTPLYKFVEKNPFRCFKCKHLLKEFRLTYFDVFNYKTKNWKKIIATECPHCEELLGISNMKI